MENYQNNYGRRYSRGEIYYIYRDPNYSYRNSPYLRDNKEGRPAIIVSNDTINALSHKVVIVYLTLNKRCEEEYCDFLLTSTKCMGSKAIVSEVTTVHKDLIGDYIGKINAEDEAALTNGLCRILELCAPDITYEPEELNENSDFTDSALALKLETVEKERDFYKDMYDDLIERLTKR